MFLREVTQLLQGQIFYLSVGIFDDRCPSLTFIVTTQLFLSGDNNSSILLALRFRTVLLSKQVYGFLKDDVNNACLSSIWISLLLLAGYALPALS